MAFELGVVAGLKTHFHLYTVPGQPELMASRRAVLRGADALVCVVDSQASRLAENRHALADVDAALEALGSDQVQIPRIYQFNKRDLPDALPLTELDRELNPRRWPAFPAKALEGEGVKDCLQAVFKLSISHIGRARTRAAVPLAAPVPVGVGVAGVAAASGATAPVGEPVRPRSPLAGPGRPPAKPRPAPPVARPLWTRSPA